MKHACKRIDDASSFALKHGLGLWIKQGWILYFVIGIGSQYCRVNPKEQHGFRLSLYVG